MNIWIALSEQIFSVLFLNILYLVLWISTANTLKLKWPNKYIPFPNKYILLAMCMSRLISFGKAKFYCEVSENKRELQN